MKTIIDLKKFIVRIENRDAVGMVELLSFYNFFLKKDIHECSDHRTQKMMVDGLKTHLIKNDIDVLINTKTDKSLLDKKTEDCSIVTDPKKRRSKKI